MNRIYIEASSFYGNRSGVGRYGLSVSEKLVLQRPNDSFVLFNFLRLGKRLDRDFSLPSNGQVKHISWFPGRIFSFLMRHGISLPIELFGILRADLLIFPNFISWASLLHKKRICVVHDIAFMHFPEYIQAKNLMFLQKQLPKSLKRSIKIVAVSEATKQDLIKHYNLQQNKVVVIHNAVDATIFNPLANSRLGQVLTKHKLPERYILFVGNLEPRKNLVGLLDAYARSFPSHQTSLVIVGAKGWNDSSIREKIGQLSDLPIHLTDFVSDADLATLYTGARAFVWPSFYEGFGIPCLEAMASGCPVICSNIPSLVEVVGNAAITINPNDTTAIAAAITKVVNDEQTREHLVMQGHTRAKLFSWEKSAKQWSELIDSLNLGVKA